MLLTLCICFAIHYIHIHCIFLQIRSEKRILRRHNVSSFRSRKAAVSRLVAIICVCVIIFRRCNLYVRLTACVFSASLAFFFSPLLYQLISLPISLFVLICCVTNVCVHYLRCGRKSGIGSRNAKLENRRNLTQPNENTTNKLFIERYQRNDAKRATKNATRRLTWTWSMGPPRENSKHLSSPAAAGWVTNRLRTYFSPWVEQH